MRSTAAVCLVLITMVIAAVSGADAADGQMTWAVKLFREQASEMNRTRREATLHRIQQLMYEKTMLAPVWQLAAMSAVGPRVEESGIGLIAGYVFFSAPYEDLKLKAR